MEMKDFEIHTNAKWGLTLNWVIDIVNTFYPISESEKKQLKKTLDKVIGDFINGCIANETLNEGD